MAPLPKDGKQQRDHGYRKKHDDKLALKPVLGLSTVENYFKTGERHGHGEYSPPIDFELARSASRGDFARELWRIGKQAARENQRNDTDGNVDEEDPSPAPVIGDPAAEGRSDGGSGNNSHAIEREGSRPLVRRKCVHEDGLFDGSQTAATNSLQNAEKDQHAKARRKTTEQRTYGKQRHANHVVALAAKDAAKPCGERQNDGVRNEITGQHPGAFVRADGQSASDVGKRHVGDGGVQKLHER